MACCGLRRRKSSKKCATYCADSMLKHDAFLRLNAVISFSELHQAIVEAVHVLIPTAEDVLVHTEVNPATAAAASNDVNTATASAAAAAHSNNLNSSTCSTLCNGWIKSLSQCQQRTELRDEELHKSEVRDMFKSAVVSTAKNIGGVICPVRDLDNAARTLLYYTFAAPAQLTPIDCQNLDFLENQIRVTCQRLERLRQAPDGHTDGTAAKAAAATLPFVSSKSSPSPSPSSSASSRQNNLLQLCGELYDQDAVHLQQKIIRYLLNQTHAVTAYLLFVSEDCCDLFCNVIGKKVLTEEMRFPLTNGVFESVLQEKKCVKLGDIAEERHAEIMRITGHAVVSFLCVPITHKTSGHVVVLACLVNKMNAEDFSDVDIGLVKECLDITVTLLSNTIAFQHEQKVKQQTQTLLQVAQNIFRKLDDLSVLLREIMSEARNLTHAERCSVFLLEKESNELVAKVFDGLPTTDKKEVTRETVELEDGTVIEQAVEIRIPATQGIAGFVATTGEMLNIKDAYSHPLFYSKVDNETGFRTRNILCFPIKDEKGSVVGVAQLCNKINGNYFTAFDEHIARSFAVYCCISLMHSLMYKKVQDAHNRNKLATELMTYHMQVSEERVTWLSTCAVPVVSTFLPDFTLFSSIPRNIREQDTSLAIVSMFEDLGLCQRFRIPRSVLARFVLMVRRGYRDPPYHNWYHAFSVAHFAYLCVKNLKLEEKSLLTNLEILAFVVASLCHDIDHRGTNNSFQMQSQSTLAALYSSEGSVLERHHFSQTVCILSSEACNIFENLNRTDYQKVLDHMRDIILATDLAHHLRIIKELESMVAEPLDPTSTSTHFNLLCLLMTSADLSDQTKNWRNTRLVASLIYEEFFSQGDMEKSLGHKPAESMDRERANVPGLQVGFLDNIALPCYKILSTCFPEQCQCLVDQIYHNRSNWVTICQQVADGKISSSNSEIIFNSKLVPEDFDE